MSHEKRIEDLSLVSSVLVDLVLLDDRGEIPVLPDVGRESECCRVRVVLEISYGCWEGDECFRGGEDSWGDDCDDKEGVGFGVEVGEGRGREPEEGRGGVGDGDGIRGRVQCERGEVENRPCLCGDGGEKMRSIRGRLGGGELREMDEVVRGEDRRSSFDLKGFLFGLSSES